MFCPKYPAIYSEFLSITGLLSPPCAATQQSNCYMGFHWDIKLTLQTLHQRTSSYGLRGAERKIVGHKEEKICFSPLGYMLI